MTRPFTQAEERPGSDIYARLILPDDSFDGISRKVWAGTPWVTNAFTDSFSSDPGRRVAMRRWCAERFGEQAWPFGQQRPGRWFEGTATVFGWTWFGFSTEAEMREFEAAWPAPQAEERG